jgi:hypothetical protein
LKRPHDLNTSPTWRKIWIYCSRSRMWESSLTGWSPFLTSTRTTTKSTPRAVLHLQDDPEKDSETRESSLVGRPPPLKTTRNPMATPNHFRAAI